MQIKKKKTQKCNVLGRVNEEWMNIFNIFNAEVNTVVHFSKEDTEIASSR